MKQRAYRERKVTQAATKGNARHRENGNKSVTVGNKTVTRRDEPFVMPEWLRPHEDLWDEWVRARVKIRKPPTEFAKRLASVRLLQLVEAGGNVRQILAQAALHNWQDFYVSKD